MTTVMPQNELTRRAIDWISGKYADIPAAKRQSQLIEEAAMRFNLGPADVEFLKRFFDGKA